MTKTAFVHFRGHEFCVYDVPGSIFLWHLILEAKERTSVHHDSWLESMIEKWSVAVAITELPHYADDDWTPEQLRLVVELCKKAINSIRRHGDFSRDEVEAWKVLDGHMVDPRGHDQIPSEPIALLGEAFIALLLGQLPEPPDQQCWFYSLELTPGTIKWTPS